MKQEEKVQQIASIVEALKSGIPSGIISLAGVRGSWAKTGKAGEKTTRYYTADAKLSLETIADFISGALPIAFNTLLTKKYDDSSSINPISGEWKLGEEIFTIQEIFPEAARKSAQARERADEQAIIRFLVDVEGLSLAEAQAKIAARKQAKTNQSID